MSAILQFPVIWLVCIFLGGIQHDRASKLPLYGVLFVSQRRAVTAENCVSKLKQELDLVMVSRLYQLF